MDIEILPRNIKLNEYDAKFYLRSPAVRDHIFTITDILGMAGFREKYLVDQFPIMVTRMRDKLKSYNNFGKEIIERLRVKLNHWFVQFIN